MSPHGLGLGVPKGGVGGSGDGSRAVLAASALAGCPGALPAPADAKGRGRGRVLARSIPVRAFAESQPGVTMVVTLGYWDIRGVSGIQGWQCHAGDGGGR